MKMKILIVIANYYPDISKGLVVSAKNTLPKKTKVNLIKVPGIFEIPVVIAKNIKKYDGFIALGCVIKGETPHFDFIATETSRALMKMIVEYDIPIGFGVLTTDDMKQAIDRSKNDNTNKGREAMDAALQVLEIYNKIKD